MRPIYVTRNGVIVNARTGKEKKTKAIPYGRDRFTIGAAHTRSYDYDKDAWFEMAQEIVRWFWYTEKILYALATVRNSKDVADIMASMYRVHCEKNVSDKVWPTVLELVYKPKIDRFIEKHRDRLSELNLMT